MAESVVSFLFNQLSVWLQEEQRFLGGFGEEVEFIREDIGQTRAFLRIADAKEESDPQLKEWVRQVREIAYDTEDVLERYMLQFAHHDAHGFRGYLKKIYVSLKNLKARHQIASEIKAIRTRLENALKRQQTFRDIYPIMNQGSSSTPAWYDGRGDALLLEEVEVVGIEKPKEQLLMWLSSIDSGLKVISVVGMAGLGKTTLVKKVFDDTSVKMNFDHHAWINVSESFKVENLLQDMIKRILQDAKQPPPQGLEAMKVDDMREFIYNFLQNENYIIVLDDVWTPNAWEAIRYVFPRTTHGRGCIIITTRFNNIGHAACSESNDHVYKLKPLPEEKSRELFYRKAFPRNSCPPYIEEISKSILNRCEGLPLAIVVIGGLLATKNNELEEWEMFSRSVGSELEGDHLKRISKLLSLSFYDLPHHLKACFLYLSVFPEDQLIDKARVLRLWIAEGFVEAKQGKTMEEIAEGYMNELLNRSLIQVAETSQEGRPRKFHIHDLVREYIISKAREQNIATVDSQRGIYWMASIRRLTLDRSINRRTQQTYEVKNLRSLLFFCPGDSECGPILYEVLRGGCRMLKVLELRGAPIDAIPDEVFKLYGLRYLGNLGKLETLDLKGCRVTKLPIEILKLQRLRNLLLYNYIYVHGYLGGVRGFNAPSEMGRLLCLQKLCYINVADAGSGRIKTVNEIGKLTQLQRLGITKLRREDGKELCSSLSKLTKLRSLDISSFEKEEHIDLEYPLSPSTLPFLRYLGLQGRLERIPQWLGSLNALTNLILRWSELREDPLQYIQGLPNLLLLGLEGDSYVGQELSFKAGGFQRLHKLSLASLGSLRWVRVEKGSMPLLHSVTVLDCKSMVEMPVGIEHLRNLKDVHFFDMTEEFVERLIDEKRKAGNQWKLAHVPVVHIVNLLNGQWKARSV
ncbi:Apoptotic ATPase [Handroanthus impetiginosus]|uniref:Apoptotic ATPase n=1 Tax=Handroanthus impetiginosus TaxID=429701 RepID=A0A2G9GBP4_9LAMI|nr:Apoptotic ATPase [Handroanthus impetiginosus]